MTRLLYSIVEGRTEKSFFDDVIAPYFANHGLHVKAIVVATSNFKSAETIRGGGSVRYSIFRKDVLQYIYGSSGSIIATMMFDLYGLPGSFPGRKDCSLIQDPYKKVEHIESCIRDDIGSEWFIPYIHLHEFESLVFVDPGKLGIEFFNRKSEISKLCAVANKFRNPELINGGFSTVPSRRILDLIPEYDKCRSGPSVVSSIGLDRLRTKCRHFNEWLCSIERLAGIAACPR